MEQIKIFTSVASDTFNKLESDVNKWLAENDKKIIEVVSRHVTSAAGVNIENRDFVNCTIVIFYRMVAK